MFWKKNLLQGDEGVSLLMSTRIKPDHDVSTSLGHQRASCSHHWWSNNLTMEDGARLHLKRQICVAATGVTVGVVQIDDQAAVAMLRADHPCFGDTQLIWRLRSSSGELKPIFGSAFGCQQK